MNSRPAARGLNRLRTLAAVAAMAVIAAGTTAQSPPSSRIQGEAVEAEECARVIETIGSMLRERYVFPDTAEACDAKLRSAHAAGTFSGVTDPETLARLLTETLQSVSRDKHLRVRVRAPQRAVMEEVNPARARAEALDRMRQNNYGFERVERLEGNVGYLDMRYFAGSPKARPTAAAAMQFLANTDAVIFDMRENGGGSPEMIQFICSYLFDEPTHLNSLYWREGDRTQAFWTLPDVPGPRFADTPAFVLTSDYTFSGAEEFSYNLQTRKRAILVGETTGGGANPGGTFPVNERFGIFIPTGRAVNPVTGVNWEGVGVTPDFVVPADDAYNAALEMARAAAEAYRKETSKTADEAWSRWGEQDAAARSLADAGREADAVRTIQLALAEAHAAGLLEEIDINFFGYDVLGRDQTALAIAIFAFNAETYPESSNVYDSLAEAHMMAGHAARAIELYQRSVELDPSNENAEMMIRRLQGGS